MIMLWEILVIGSLFGIFQQLPAIVPSLLFRQSRMPPIQPISILLLLFLAKGVYTNGVCAQREMACGAQIRSYPLLRPEEISRRDIESDMEDFPLYDESFTPAHIFDFSKAANLTNEKICDCPNDTNCDLKEENIIKLDEMIILVFCDRIDDIFKRPCRGERSLIRVIGRIDESGEALTNVVKTFLFCKCERGYQRVYVEVWRNHLYAFIYRCL